MEKLIETIFKWFKIQFENDKNIFVNGKLTEFGAMLFCCSCLGLLEESFSVIKEVLIKYEKK